MYTLSFNEKLIKARKEAGFTQKNVSQEVNIGRSTLANYESGRTEPSLNNLVILADLYGVSTDWLLGAKGGKKDI